MLARFLFVLAACFGMLGLACSGDDENGEPPPAATAPPATETPHPPPTSTVMPFTRVPLTFWLLDAETGAVSVVLEDFERQAWSAEFGAAATTVTLSHDAEGQHEARQFDLHGNALGQAQPPGRCDYGSTEIDGAEHRDADCTAGFGGSPHHPAIAPGGAWFTYAVPDSTAYERWVLSLSTGERLLLEAGLQDCSGCEAGGIYAWSPSGRYLYFVETGPDQRVFLSDMDAGWTRDITAGEGASVHLGVPEWAPEDDRLLLMAAGGGVRLHDMRLATVVDFPDIAWPARFDASGEYLYTPASGAEPDGFTTTIAESATGEVVATLAGSVPPATFWGFLLPPVAATEDGFVAVLEHAPDCDGTAIYVDGERAGCVSGGFGAAISPDGRRVALARVTGFTGEIEFLGGSSFSLPINEIVMFDVETAEESVVAEGAISEEPPYFAWNGTATHLLIQWPFHATGP